MIQKATIISISDKCGIFTGNVFHIFRGFYHKIGKPKDFVKFSTRSTSASLSNLKGSKINGIFIRSKKEQLKIDGSFFKFKQNSVVSLKKRLTPRGKELVGPVSKSLSRKKFLLTFAGIF
jgi:large subunit ribosomal protein L14